LSGKSIALSAQPRELCEKILRGAVTIDLISEAGGTSPQFFLPPHQGGLLRLCILGQRTKLILHLLELPQNGAHFTYHDHSFQLRQHS
jgi:hypothetical protein